MKLKSDDSGSEPETARVEHDADGRVSSFELPDGRRFEVVGWSEGYATIRDEPKSNYQQEDDQNE